LFNCFVMVVCKPDNVLDTWVDKTTVICQVDSLSWIPFRYKYIFNLLLLNIFSFFFLRNSDSWWNLAYMRVIWYNFCTISSWLRDVHVLIKKNPDFLKFLFNISNISYFHGDGDHTLKKFDIPSVNVLKEVENPYPKIYILTIHEYQNHV